MDLLGSILGSMETPPSKSDAEKKKIKAQKEMLEKLQDKERKNVQDFREQMQMKINNFIKDGKQEKLKFGAMDKTQRSILHEVADIASLASFSFGLEEQDRYVMIWKKEFAPSDDELLAYRRDEEWDPAKAKRIAEDQALAQLALDGKKESKKMNPPSNYKDKYKHLIGETAAKDAAQSTVTNRSYGFVSSENKRDQRTIEQVLAESRAKKKLKTQHNISECGSHEGSVKSEDQSAKESETQSKEDCNRSGLASATS